MRLLKPDDFYVSLLDIMPEALAASGIKAVLLDIDNTVLPRTTDVLAPEMLGWIDNAKACGLKVCFLSNSLKQRAVNAAEQADVVLVGKALKPLPHGYFRACKALGVKRKEALMVGDQTYTDILGAHLTGVRAVLVAPLASKDLWHTKLLRAVDHFATRSMEPKRKG